MSAQLLDIEAPPQMGRPKKLPTEPVRIGADVLELAWRVAVHKGYRQAGEFLTDLLRPLLSQMERESMAERSRLLGPADPADRPAPPPPKKGGKG